MQNSERARPFAGPGRMGVPGRLPGAEMSGSREPRNTAEDAVSAERAADRSLTSFATTEGERSYDPEPRHGPRALFDVPALENMLLSLKRSPN